MYRRNNLGDKIFMGVVWLILTSFAFICLYPFYIVIINSDVYKRQGYGGRR